MKLMFFLFYNLVFGFNIFIFKFFIMNVVGENEISEVVDDIYN